MTPKAVKVATETHANLARKVAAQPMGVINSGDESGAWLRFFYLRNLSSHSLNINLI